MFKNPHEPNQHTFKINIPTHLLSYPYYKLLNLLNGKYFSEQEYRGIIFALSQNLHITSDIINNNPGIPWLSDYFLSNFNIYPELLKKYDKPDIDWDDDEMNAIFNQEMKSFSTILKMTESDITTDKLLLFSCLRAKLNYLFYFHTNTYRQRMTKKMYDKIRDELISKVCTPKRMFNWNEDLKYDFPEEYNEECERYKNMFPCKLI